MPTTVDGKYSVTVQDDFGVMTLPPNGLKPKKGDFLTTHNDTEDWVHIRIDWHAPESNPSRWQGPIFVLAPSQMLTLGAPIPPNATKVVVAFVPLRVTDKIWVLKPEDIFEHDDKGRQVIEYPFDNKDAEHTGDTTIIA